MERTVFRSGNPIIVDRQVVLTGWYEVEYFISWYSDPSTAVVDNYMDKIDKTSEIVDPEMVFIVNV